MQEEQSNENDKFTEVIKSSDLGSLSKDYAEIAIDGFLDEGVLKDIPIVGSFVSLLKLGNTIHKNIATKKLYSFLYQLKDIDQEKRLAKIDEINQSKKYRSEVGQNLFELLDKLDSDYKPEIVGRLFTAVINEEIDYRSFLKLSSVLKQVFIYDLLDLKDKIIIEKASIIRLKEAVPVELYNLGLVVIDHHETYNERVEGEMIRDQHSFLTDLGIMLYYYGLK